jgi:hypothetical protein
MKTYLKATAALATVLAIPAIAKEDEFKAAIGRENNNRCRMDTCEPFTLTSSTLVNVTPDGVFYKVTYLSREDEYRPRDDGRNEYDYPPIKRGKNELYEVVVFCSKTRPSIDELALRPGDEYNALGPNEWIHLVYWAACHNYIPEGGASPKLAKKLGYHLAPDPEPRIHPL